VRLELSATGGPRATRVGYVGESGSLPRLLPRSPVRTRWQTSGVNPSRNGVIATEAAPAGVAMLSIADGVDRPDSDQTPPTTTAPATSHQMKCCAAPTSSGVPTNWAGVPYLAPDDWNPKEVEYVLGHPQSRHCGSDLWSTSRDII
jgi:hypothetical protein